MNSKKSFYEQELDRLVSENPLSEYHYAYIRQSKAFMEQHLAKELKLEEMAAAAFMSRFHFIRVFRKVYGLTPRQFLKDLRISRAKELLKTGLSVTEVSNEVGYSSLPTFSIAFKRGTRYSPKAYQELYKSNPE